MGACLMKIDPAESGDSVQGTFAEVACPDKNIWGKWSDAESRQLCDKLIIAPERFDFQLCYRSVESAQGVSPKFKQEAESGDVVMSYSFFFSIRITKLPVLHEGYYHMQVVWKNKPVHLIRKEKKVPSPPLDW